MRNLEDPVLLCSMLTGLVDAGPGTAAAARLWAERILQRTPPHELLRLEQEVRYRTRSGAAYYSSDMAGSPWRRLDGAGLLRASMEPLGHLVVRMASFHANGFLREEAVRLLDGESGGDALPFLLLRCNDWVPAVQRRAQIAVENRIDKTHASHFLRSHVLVEQLAAQKRNDLQSLHQRIKELLRSRAAEPARRAAFSDADRHVRRAAFVLSCEADDVDLRSVIVEGLKSGDLWVRVFSARTARARLYGAALREVLGQARGDRSAPVRREALLGFIEDHPELRQSLLDPCSSLREMVRFYLRRKANLDFAAIYRAELEQLSASTNQSGLTSRLVTAIAGLGESGSANDADLVEMYTIDARPRVRRTALLALARLDGENRLATLSAALSDDSPRVARTALHALGSRLVSIGESALRRALEEQKDARCRDAIAAALHVFERR